MLDSWIETLRSRAVSGLLAAALIVRVLVDHEASPYSRHTGSLGVSGLIALTLMLVAVATVLLRRRGMVTIAVASAWIAIWTLLAVAGDGASGETVREGVREASVVAVATIVYSAIGRPGIRTAARIVQAAGFAPAVLALYQLATHGGMDVGGNLRSNGTFAHPNSAAMFFSLAALASLWLYLDAGRRRFDAALALTFAAGLVSTYSIDGLVTLAAMLCVYGALRPGSLRVKLLPAALAFIVGVAFLATPLGDRRLQRESGSRLTVSAPGEANSSFSWRLYKWRSLLDEWEKAPVLGQGLGTTTTGEGSAESSLRGDLPHNEYIRYLVETGIVGLLILLGGVFLLVRGLLRRRRAEGAALAAAALAGCLVNSAADNTLLNSPTCYAAALIVFAVIAVAAPVRESPAEAGAG